MKCWEQLFHIGFLRRTVFTSSQTWGHGAPITTTVTESERLSVSHGPEGLGQGFLTAAQVSLCGMSFLSFPMIAPLVFPYFLFWLSRRISGSLCLNMR